MQQASREHEAGTVAYRIGCRWQFDPMRVAMEQREDRDHGAGEQDGQPRREQDHHAQNEHRHGDADLHGRDDYIRHAQGCTADHHGGKDHGQQEQKGTTKKRAPQTYRYHGEQMIRASERMHEACLKTPGKAGAFMGGCWHGRQEQAKGNQGLAARVSQTQPFAAGRVGICMKKTLAALALALAATSAAAHDFWLQPKAFRYKGAARVPVTVQVGHGAARQRWATDSKRIMLLAGYGPDGRSDLRNGLRRPTEPADLIPVFKRPGVHILALQTNHAVSELPPIRFNDYAAMEGLTPAIALRSRNRTTGAPGREIYSRRAKALILIGPASAQGDAMATRPIGLSLEIVPERDPYALGKSRQLPVHVIFEGKRLAGATVKLTSLEFDSKPVATAKTDRNGRAVFQVPPVGEWLINVIWTKPISGDPRADFDTTFSSLTFGYDPPPSDG